MTAQSHTAEPWKCAGCGAESVSCERTCACPTGCLYRREGGRTVSALKAEKIGPWRIWYEPPPIPIRTLDWHYQHEETDLDCPSWMNGSCASRDACLTEIIDGYEDRAATATAKVTGNAIADAVTLGFLHGVGRQPWDDMHDYIAVSALDYANGKQGAREHLEAKPTPEGIDWSEFEDGLSDAIQDSIDMDWNSRDGAKAVIRWLNEHAPRPAPIPEAAFQRD